MMSFVKSFIRLSVFAKVAIVLALVAGYSVANQNKLVIAVSFAPLANIVETIGGDEVEVITLLPSGTDPYNYTPKDKELKEFSRADYYFTEGSGVGRAWFPRFKKVKANVNVVDLSKGVVWISGKNNEPDPFFWSSPKVVSQIASNVRATLSKLRPEKNDYFVLKLSHFLNRFNRADESLKRAVYRLPENLRVFVTTSPRYGYLTRDYKFLQKSVDVNEKNLTPKELKKVVETGRKNGVRFVFVTPKFNKKDVASIKKDLGAEVLVLDPMQYNFFENIKAITDALNKVADERLEQSKADPKKNPFYKK